MSTWKAAHASDDFTIQAPQLEEHRHCLGVVAGFGGTEVVLMAAISEVRCRTAGATAPCVPATLLHHLAGPSSLPSTTFAV